MAPLVDLASKSEGRKRSSALGDLTVKYSKFEKEEQSSSSSSNPQEESNEACSDCLPPMSLVVDEGPNHSFKCSAFWLFDSNLDMQEEQVKEAQYAAGFGINVEPMIRMIRRMIRQMSWQMIWQMIGTGGYWGHNHDECIKSFDWVSDASHVSPYSSPPHEPNVLPYNLDDKYQLDPRWFDRSMEVCLEEIRQESLAMQVQLTPPRPALESGRGD